MGLCKIAVTPMELLQSYTQPLIYFCGKSASQYFLLKSFKKMANFIGYERLES